jgi:hypothetical protein
MTVTGWSPFTSPRLNTGSHKAVNVEHQCFMLMQHILALMASNFYYKLKSVLFVIIIIVMIRNVYAHALLLSHSPTQTRAYE